MLCSRYIAKIREIIFFIDLYFKSLKNGKILNNLNRKSRFFDKWKKSIGIIVK